jgi:hypothetical protein
MKPMTLFAENPRRKMLRPLDPEEAGMICPECGLECEVRHAASGLDYDWCSVCDHEVSCNANYWDNLWQDFSEADYGNGLEARTDWNV